MTIPHTYILRSVLYKSGRKFAYKYASLLEKNPALKTDPEDYTTTLEVTTWPQLHAFLESVGREVLVAYNELVIIDHWDLSLMWPYSRQEDYDLQDIDPV